MALFTIYPVRRNVIAFQNELSGELDVIVFATPSPSNKTILLLVQFKLFQRYAVLENLIDARLSNLLNAVIISWEVLN